MQFAGRENPFNRIRDLEAEIERLLALRQAAYQALMDSDIEAALALLTDREG